MGNWCHSSSNFIWLLRKLNKKRVDVYYFYRHISSLFLFSSSVRNNLLFWVGFCGCTQKTIDFEWNIETICDCYRFNGSKMNWISVVLSLNWSIFCASNYTSLQDDIHRSNCISTLSQIAFFLSFPFHSIALKWMSHLHDSFYQK